MRRISLEMVGSHLVHAELHRCTQRLLWGPGGSYWLRIGVFLFVLLFGMNQRCSVFCSSGYGPVCGDDSLCSAAEPEGFLLAALWVANL